MKSLTTLILILLCAATAGAAPLAYWHLDEAAGNYVDAAGSYDMTRHAGTLNTTDPPTMARGENVGSQTALRAVAGRISALDLTSNQWTVEGYFRSTYAGRQFIASNNPNGAGGRGGWDLEVGWQVSGALTLRIQTITSTAVLVNGSTFIADGNWHHWALTWDSTAGAQGTISLYVDGQLDGNGAGAGDQGSNSGLLFYTGGFLLGTGVFYSAYGTTGELDEIRISDTALSPSEFLYAEDPYAHGPCSDPTGRYIIGDANYDCTVDVEDLRRLMYHWLEVGSPPYYHGNVDEDAAIDLADVGILCNHWLNEATRPAAVTGLTAVCRDGQVFITWNEANLDERNLKVYQHHAPITAANLADATVLCNDVGPASANDFLDDPVLCPRATGPAHGWILQDGAAGLDRSGGLYVHTVTPADAPQAYYGVLAEDEDAPSVRPGDNALTTPVAQTVAPRQAIWQLGAADPEDRPGSAGKALVLYLHSHTSRPSGGLHYLTFGDSTMGWRDGLPFKFKVTVSNDYVLVEPYDRVWINRRLGASETYETYNTLYPQIESWWYGTNDRIDDAVARLTGTPTNYTEHLLLWILDWVQQTYQTDPQKVYAFGASMGTGVQRLVLQNPQRFASCDLLVPFVDFAYENGAESNAKRFGASCGDVDLICSDGMPLRDRLDLVDFMAATTGDLPFICIRVGRQDNSVYWRRKPPYIAAMQQNRHGLIVGWDNGTHSTAMRYTVAGLPNWFDFSWYIQRFALDRSYPAFTNFSLDDDPGNGDRTDGDIVGFINRGMDFDPASIVDTSNRYEIELSCSHPAAIFPVTVDVTPRRRQQFLPPADTVLTAQNYAPGPTLVETKTITVQPDGRVTYDAFAITTGQGNLLVLTY